MQFLILKNEGILLDGNPVALTDLLTLSFENVAEGAEVIINTGESVFYRNVNDGKVTLNKNYLEEGELYVTVAPDIKCDRLYVIREGNTVVISGDYTEREARIKKLRSEFSSLNDRIENLERRLREIYDGHELL